jgi:hypothetical protein
VRLRKVFLLLFLLQSFSARSKKISKLEKELEARLVVFSNNCTPRKKKKKKKKKRKKEKKEKEKRKRIESYEKKKKQIAKSMNIRL